MMAGVGSWLLSITGASVLCALADGLMPAGPVRRVGRLVCGLVLLAVILAPLAQLDLEGGQRWLEEYHLGLEDRTQELERQVDEQMKRMGEFTSGSVEGIMKDYQQRVQSFNAGLEQKRQILQQNRKELNVNRSNN